MNRLRTSIRVKLTATILLPLIATVALCWVVGASLMTTRLITIAQQAVATDLNAAERIVSTELLHVAEQIKLASQSPAIVALLQQRHDATALETLRKSAQNSRLSFLTVTDRYGNPLYRLGTSDLSGRIGAENALVSDALAGQEARSIEVLSAAAARRENPQLPAAMTVPVHATPHAQLHTVAEEVRGMFLSAALPLRNDQGEVIGAIWGGSSSIRTSASRIRSSRSSLAGTKNSACATAMQRSFSMTSASAQRYGRREEGGPSAA